MKKFVKITALILASAAIFTALLAGSLVIYTRRTLNFEGDEVLFEKSLKWESTSFYASADPYGEYSPVKIETAGHLEKQYFPLEEISPLLIDGFVAVEDARFWEHKGVDLRRTLYAAFNYIFRSKKLFGGSTITQQVVKNVSGDNGPTLKRKLSEILRAGNLERNYSKEEIMSVYLNVIPMSENIYGVGRASLSFFGKAPSELTAAEAATLIGITNAPTAYNPYTNPEKCVEKRNRVLAVMEREGVIDRAEYDSAVAEPLELLPRELTEGKSTSWFVETVIDDASLRLAEKYGLSESGARMMLLGGGYSVYTTADPRLQQIAEEYFADASNFPREISEGLNYAFVVTDSQTGDLRAIVGRVGEKNGNRLLNHATVPHTPASVLKPLALYAPLIDEGRICWSTVLDDVPTDFYKDGDTYRPYPRNSPDAYDGLTTVADGIRLSKNTLAVRLLRMRGERATYTTLHDGFGVDTLVERRKSADGGTLTDLGVAPLALGQLTDGVTLRKLTECFGVFAADGVLHSGRSFVRVTDSEGRVVLDNGTEEKRLFDKSTARIMNQLLHRVVETGTASAITLDDIVDTAGKTGTSGGSLDKLFVGYTPYLCAGIWCGYDDGVRAVTGLSVSHLKIWDELMKKLHAVRMEGEQVRGFSTEGLIYRPYCTASGGLYSDECLLDPRGTTLAYGYFTPETQPRTLCDRHEICDYDSEKKGIAGEDCPDERRVKVSLLLITDRDFPCEVEITDAEFVYRGEVKVPYCGGDLPYFYSTLPDGKYAGKSKKERQFNAGCDEEMEE